MERESLTKIFLKSTLYIQIVLYFLLIIILLLFSALISGSETAFFCLEKKTIDKEIKKNPYKGDKVLKILKNKKKLLATILISNNFSNIGIVILSSSLITEYFFKNSFFYKVPINFLLEVILLTFILLLFGEIIPKIYARKNNFRFAILMSQTIINLSKILEPISKIMIIVSRFIEKRMKKKKNRISVDQLSKALKIASSNQKNIKECQFLKRIVDFGNTETHQIMTPRIDMFALNKNTLFSNTLELVCYQGYSRIPIYKDSIDDIEGVLFAKDLLPFIHEKEFEWTQLIHTPFFVPENKKIDDLLNDFKKIKIHLAIVVDEYGGTCGIVTLEDVIEEIVGDIIDEFDEENLSYSKLNHNNYLFDGKTSLIDFYRIMKIKEEVFFEKKKGDADTLGGFIMEINKEFPKKKQKINFLNYSFLIRRIDNKRIKSIEVIRKKN
ncbi:gliding motility-associated protein GldE [Blattabacterium punctulatus]|uniref:Gliding motility-associated protein GldE n=1 Tax=Blattabacterium punctulatus TaxID=164514 RepID=A0ABM6WN63_9FLAO|nr:gliding motility-associated protein GldE [Blattabacterium punctulatus]AWU40029.1 gliding motility-associated protein GldE [Blattabacterium punctulatus]AWU40571.1 gliding motility-associated protein GldE [Blattabacterium punctulatus]